ncbi:hypothetical protein MTO96_004198 [Rhipicephalus appendiculatus]
MKQDLKTERLLEKAFPDGDFILQQDCSPIHTYKLASSNLQQHGVAVLEWPPQSPDIENISGNMKAAVCSSSLHGLSSDNLWSAVQDCWKEAKANVEICDALYASLLDRMRGGD